MFKRLVADWKASHAEVLRKEFIEQLEFVKQFGLKEVHEFVYCIVDIYNNLHSNYGDLQALSLQNKKSLIKNLKREGREIVHDITRGLDRFTTLGTGAAPFLVACNLEASLLPGEDARFVYYHSSEIIKACKKIEKRKSEESGDSFDSDQIISSLHNRRYEFLDLIDNILDQYSKEF